MRIVLTSRRGKLSIKELDDGRAVIVDESGRLLDGDITQPDVETATYIASSILAFNAQGDGYQNPVVMRRGNPTGTGEQP